MRLSGRILAITLIAIIIVIATSYVVGIMLVGLKGSESFLELVSLEKAMGFKDMAIQTAATHTATSTVDAYMAGTEYPSVRMLVRSGNLELESEDPETAADRIILIVESYGGYVARLSSSDGEKKSVSIVVKVPESAFYKVLAEIRRIGKVVGEDVSVQDVTEQYVDLEARLRNLRAEEE